MLKYHRVLWASMAHSQTGSLTASVSVQLQSAVDEGLEWLEDNSDAEQDDYEEKLKEVEDVANPIIQGAYGAAGGPGGDDDDDLGDHDEL